MVHWRDLNVSSLIIWKSLLVSVWVHYAQPLSSLTLPSILPASAISLRQLSVRRVGGTKGRGSVVTRPSSGHGRAMVSAVAYKEGEEERDSQQKQDSVGQD